MEQNEMGLNECNAANPQELNQIYYTGQIPGFNL